MTKRKIAILVGGITAVIIIALTAVILLSGGENGGIFRGSSKISLVEPSIEADGKKLALPCTLQELLEFGFTVERIPNLSNKFDSINDALVSKQSGMSELIYVKFTDDSEYVVRVSNPDSGEIPLTSLSKNLPAFCQRG